MSQHRLDILNVDNDPTFVRREQESVLNLAICPGINQLGRREVLDEETLSRIFHRMIYFELRAAKPSSPTANGKARQREVAEF